MTIIKDAAFSRKLSEKNDPYGTNLKTILEMVQFRIDQSCNSGVYSVSVCIKNSILNEVINELIAHEYKIETRRGLLSDETRVDISWGDNS